MNKTIPDGWTSVSMDQIFTTKQYRKVMKILLKKSGNDSKLKELKEYLSTIKEDLKSKGVDHGFIAYVIYNEFVLNN